MADARVQPDPEPPGAPRLYAAAIIGIGAALAAAWWLPPIGGPPWARLLVAGGLGITLYAAVLPPAAACAGRRAVAATRRLARSLDRYADDGDRTRLPDPRTLRDPVARRLAESVRRLASGAAAAESRHRVLERTMSDRVDRETRRRTRHLERDATSDPLTGLGNRRRLEQTFEALFDGATRRTDDTVAMLAFDLDHFKQVNDTLGHQVGDECLVALGTLLGAQLRDEDEGVRLGGDEFLVILPGLGEREAAKVAQRILALHGQIPWSHPTVVAPTLSIGVAAVHAAMADAGELLLERADAALYHVKGQGRNGVATWSGSVARRSA